MRVSIFLFNIFFGLLVTKDIVIEIQQEFEAWREVPYNLSGFPKQLKAKLYGQHLVQEDLPSILRAHFNGRPSKPLVLSFHGPPGCGKNYVAYMIADSIHKKGRNSYFIDLQLGTRFHDKTMTSVYKERLWANCIEKIKKHPMVIFIIDEVDKMADMDVLSALKPFFEPNPKTTEFDFRKAVFIFLSNEGSNEIFELTTKRRDRLSLELNDFESILKNSYKSGRRSGNAVIDHDLIDAYIPFLPLEQSHVIKCIEDHLDSLDPRRMYARERLIETILKRLEWKVYGNLEPKIYSESGCKRVEQMTKLVLNGKIEL